MGKGLRPSRTSTNYSSLRMRKQRNLSCFDIDQKETNRAIHQGIVQFLFKGNEPYIPTLTILPFNRCEAIVCPCFFHLFVGKANRFFFVNSHSELLSARRIFISITRFWL